MKNNSYLLPFFMLMGVGIINIMGIIIMVCRNIQNFSKTSLIIILAVILAIITVYVGCLIMLIRERK